MKYRSITLLLLPVLFAINSRILCAQNPEKTTGYAHLISSRDSLQKLRKTVPETDSKKQYAILKNLFDIDRILGDSTYVMPLWHEAVRQKDVNTIDDLVVSLVLRYMRRGNQELVDLWLERNNVYMPEPRRTENEEFFRLRADIQNVNEQDLLAEKILAEQVTINPKREPYKAMRILYTLAVITNRGDGTLASKNLKSSREYKKEALDIAEKLPLRDVAHFRGQILLGMSMINVDYAKRFLDFNVRLLDDPGIKERPFYSRLRIVASLESLIMVGSELPRKELDGYYTNLMQLLKTNPQDTPCAFDQFYARTNYYYSQSTGNLIEALRWSDSLINILPKYHLPTHYQKSARAELLCRLERWEEAYLAAQELRVIKDSLNTIGTEKKIAELQTQYGVDHLRFEHKTKHQQLLYALLGCILLAALAVLLWYHSKMMRKKNLVLCQQLKMALETERKLELVRRDYTEQQAIQNGEMPLICRLEKLMHAAHFYANENISRDSVASALGTNRTYLSNAIRETYSQTFPEYITSLRLNAAIGLIELNNQSTDMQSISEQVGYTSYTSFYRAFIKRYGVKPTDYLHFLKTKRDLR